MSNPNDSRIIDLKAQIEKARAEVGAALKFAPKTSCVYDIDGVKYNLHAASQPDLLYLLAKLTALHSGAAAHGLEGELTICGFPIRDCIDDVLAKYADAERAGRAVKLKMMEATLDKLLSDDKKKEMEIEKIADMLGKI